MITRHRFDCSLAIRAGGLVSVAALLAACAAPGPNVACAPGEEHMVMETVYFGTNIPGGGKVSVEQWEAFLDSVITPRFPDGLTSFKADGQWRNNAGQIETESTYVLQVLHADSPQSGTAIREVATLYQTRFRQESVLRVRNASCISFNRASG